MGTGKPRPRTFVVYLHNLIDSRDDDIVKVKARTHAEARSRADYNAFRFTLGAVYTLPDFKRFHPGWF